MNKSEDERKADALEASCVEIQDCVPTLACGETSMIEDSFNSDCLGEEKGISDVGAKDYLQDVNSKMHFAEGIQFHEIVKAGEPGLRSLYDVENFLELMHNSGDLSQKKDCLATLIATENESIFEKFLNDGGWDKLFEWLEESKKVEDATLLVRLLDLYRLLPVTVQMLKQNSCAKSIKQLIKSPNEVISQQAKVIINDWMLKVTLNKQKEHGNHKSKKLKHIGKQKSDDSEKSNDADETSQSPTSLEKHSSRKRSSSGSTDSLLSDVKITVRILPPRPSQPEPAPPQGFMNALSSVHLLPERKKKKVRRPSQSAANTNATNYNRDSAGILDGEDDDEKTDIEDGSAQEAAPLIEAKLKSCRKTVTWADEGSLCIFHYFPMDETERVNVNHMADFNEIRRHEIEMEHRMFQNSRRNLHNDLQLADQWRRPPFITGVSYLVEPGCNSTERKTQMMREQNVLQVLYFNKRLLTDQPAEPDSEFVEITEPKQIPLSDVTGTNSEVLYEHTGNIASSASSSSSSSSSLSSTSSSSELTTTNNCSDVQLSSSVVTTQSQPSVSPSVPWGNMYNIPPPVMTPVMDPQVMQMMPPIISPMYPPGFIPPPGFAHPPPHLLPPEFLRGYRPPVTHIPLAMPMPSFGGSTKPPCTHFLAGNCKFGSNCRFFHPPSTESPSAKPPSSKT